MKEMVVDLALEPEVKEILDDHTEKIQKLEIANAITKEKLNSIDTQVKDMKIDVSNLNGAITKLENTVLSGNNATMQALTQLLCNTTKKNSELASNVVKNKTQISLKLIGLIGASITGIITITSLIIKAVFY